MTNAFINITKAIVFTVIAASAIVSLYAAVNALSVYTDIDVFLSGLVAIMIGVALGPLFCFIAVYGMVFYLDLPVGEAVVITAPAFVAWSFAAVRTLSGLVAR